MLPEFPSLDDPRHGQVLGRVKLLPVALAYCQFTERRFLKSSRGIHGGTPPDGGLGGGLAARAFAGALDRQLHLLKRSAAQVVAGFQRAFHRQHPVNVLANGGVELLKLIEAFCGGSRLVSMARRTALPTISCASRKVTPFACTK